MKSVSTIPIPVRLFLTRVTRNPSYWFSPNETQERSIIVSFFIVRQTFYDGRRPVVLSSDCLRGFDFQSLHVLMNSSSGTNILLTLRTSSTGLSFVLSFWGCFSSCQLGFYRLLPYPRMISRCKGDVYLCPMSGCNNKKEGIYVVKNDSSKELLC